jgi:hypothetical protein
MTAPVRSRKRCPVCYVFKTYAGHICQSCLKAGYKVRDDGSVRRDMKPEQKSYLKLLIQRWVKVKPHFEQILELFPDAHTRKFKNVKGENV